MNDRSSWEEVWRIKAKFEALTEHAKKVGDIHFCKGSATTSTKEIGRESLSCAPLKVSTRETGGESLGPAPPKVFVYSSVSEWESLVTVEMELLLSKHKLELAQFVNQKLLPLLPVANCPTQVMQTIFELVEISKPIYVKLSDSETNY